MGFGQLLTDKELRQFKCIQQIRTALDQQFRDNHLFSEKHVAIHSRTQAYKNDDHMEFRNSDISDIIDGLPERLLSSYIGIVGHYPRHVLEKVTCKILAIGSTPFLAPCNCEDFYIAGTSVAFISTSSGPGHLAAYLVPTLFLNATCLTPTNTFTNLVTISTKAISYKIRPSLVGVSLDEVIMLLLGDYWATEKFTTVFNLYSLDSIDIGLELTDWLDNRDSGRTYTLGSLSHSTFKKVPQSRLQITRRTHDMINKLIISYS